LIATKKRYLFLVVWFKKNKSINRKELEFIQSKDIQVFWQCGKFYFEEYKKYNSKNVQVVAFIDRMDLIYAVLDFVISRAGASSVSSYVW
jgi:UDP-N-acetylglucosamine:LPS N-acetylglucosamine transferase